MQRNRWLPLAGIALTIMLGACATVCLLALLLWQAASSIEISEPSPTASSTESLPVPTPVHRNPTDPERQTAETIAHTLVPQRDLLDLARRLQGLAPDQGLGAQTPAPTGYAMGDTETFWLHNVGAKAFFTSTATLQYETDHAYWWVEDGYRIPQADLAQSAEVFEKQTYPANRRIFNVVRF